MNSIDTESEREAFEAWMNVDRPSLLKAVRTYLSNVDIHIDSVAWDGWLAAKRHAESTFRRDAESYWELEDFLGIGAGTDAQSAIRVIKEMIEAARNEGIKAHKLQAAQQSGKEDSP